MMGFRGCRLSVVYPEITEMQTRAIFGDVLTRCLFLSLAFPVFTPRGCVLRVGAALDCMKEGITVSPQIMIPLVCSDHEISFIVPIIRNAYALVCEQYASVYGDQVCYPTLFGSFISRTIGATYAYPSLSLLYSL